MLSETPLVIRGEQKSDFSFVYAVNAVAFETPAEAKLVETLRAEAAPVVSLVAEKAGAIVGHILFSPVHISGCPDLNR